MEDTRRGGADPLPRLQERIDHLGVLAEEHSALRRVATLVASEAPPQDVIAAVSEEACRVLGARSSLVCRFLDESSCLVAGRWDGREAGGFPVGTIVPLVPEMALSRVRRTGLPARLDDYEGVPGETAAEIRALGFVSVVCAPVTVASEIWGALVVGTDATDRMPDDAEQRLGDFSELVALAVASADARAELAASRTRIVESADAERRRLERNLHDGAQQRMVGMALSLRLAQARVRSDPGAAEQMLERARAELGHALEELRELARGIHPAVLSDHGLCAALDALAARASIAVDVEVTVQDRLPDPVEVAVYYVASEALANVAKYAGAHAATVRVERVRDHAVVEIADEGVGGARPSPGSGLSGLADRVAALGGRLRIESPEGRGTRIRAELPAACRTARGSADPTDARASL